MYKQTEEKYKNVALGFGSGSIYNFGCYLVSLCNGLNQKGYSLNPESLNDLIKSKNAYIGEFRNYIDVSNLDNYLPDIFNGEFQQIEPWNDVPKTADLLTKDQVVVCKVNAQGIGGSGSHFVLLVGIENGIAVIHDPWTGNTEKITVRYGKLKNILGLRIFKIKPYIAPVVNPTVEKLSKNDVARDILMALCGSTSDDEVNAYINSGKNIKEIVTDICQGNDRYFNKWVKPNIPAPTPIPTPIHDCGAVEIELSNSRTLASTRGELLLKVKNVTYGKGWPWVKINSIKALI